MQEAKYPIHSKLFFTSIIMLVMPLSGIGIDIYLPSLPAVTRYFNVDKTLVQLTISSYMFGFAMMQFIAGPISDTYGRRIPYLIFMLVFVGTSTWVPYSESIHEMLILRFIQGASIAGAVVPIRSITADAFTGRERDKVVNYMAIAWSIGPIIAPAIGGYIQHYIGWKYNFYLLAAYSLILFVVGLLFLPETNPEKHSLKPLHVLKRYADIFMHPEFLVGMTINGLLYSLIIVFSVVGPFLIQEKLHYSAIAFGHMALLLGVAWFGGSMTNRFLLHVELERKERWAFSSMLAISILMLVISSQLPLNVYELLLPLLAIFWLGSMIFPASFARNFELFTKASGSASSLFSGMLFFITAITAALATNLKVASAVPIAGSYIVLSACCLVLSLIRVKVHRDV